MIAVHNAEKSPNPVSKGDATRERILEAAAAQASVRGFAGVSLQEVADAVGLSKSGLFKHFDAKEAMQLALLERASARFLAHVWEPSRHLPDARTRLSTVFDAWLEWVAGADSPGGCLLTVASMEMDDQPGLLRDYLRGSLGRWRGRVGADFADLADLSEDDIDQACFEMKGFVYSYNEQRRLLEDARARERARTAFTFLLDRLERRAAA